MEALRNEFVSVDIDPFYISAASAAVSKDGTLAATAMESDVIVTNLSTGEVVHKIEGDDELVTSVVMTPNKRKLAVLSQSQQLRIIDLETMTTVKSMRMDSPVYISTADDSSSLFAFGATDGSVTVWDVEGSYVTHSLKGHGATICSLRFYGSLNSTDWRLASGDIMGTIKVWDLVKRRSAHTIREHNSAVRGLGFSDDGEYLISGGRDRIIIIYNAKTFKILNTFGVQEQVENSGFVKCSWKGEEDQIYFYFAGTNNTLSIWNFEGKVIARSTEPLRTAEELMITDVIGLENSKMILVVSDQTFAIVDLKGFFPNTEILELPIIRRIAGNHGTIADIRYVGPDFGLFALATNSPSLRIVDPHRPLDLHICAGHTDLLDALDVSVDGKWIATASKDGDARLWKWDGEKFTPYCLFKGHVGSVSAVGLPRTHANYPRFVVSASSDLTVKLWKVPEPSDDDDNEIATIKTSVYTRKAHDKDINAIDVSPNDQFFATASYDKLGKIWDLTSGEVVGVLRGHKRGLWDINFCKYDKLIATASGDKTIKVWHLNDYLCTRTFEGHTNSVLRAKFFNKNFQIASCGADGLIKLWDVSELGGESLKTLNNHNNRIWALDLRNDGKLFVSADADGQISTWDDKTEDFLKEQDSIRRRKVEQDQDLNNYINSNDWSNAFLLALTLDHPMRLYNIIKGAMGANEDSESPVGSFKLENTLSLLSDDQLLNLLKKIRDWNVNRYHFEVSHKVLNVIFNKFGVHRLLAIPGVMKAIEPVIPYSERHFNRVNEMMEQSFMLDYTIEQMNKLN